jgi:hypothetical protein
MEPPIPRSLKEVEEVCCRYVALDMDKAKVMGLASHGAVPARRPQEDSSYPGGPAHRTALS